MLLLPDNDLPAYEGVDHEEVLRLCSQFNYELETSKAVHPKAVVLTEDNVTWIKGQQPSQEDIDRFKELLPAIKEYVAARLLLYDK